LRVLAVEDDASFGWFIRECLAETGEIGFEVHLVDRLEKAVAAATGSEFDLVLLDLGLPDSWGLETFHRFRRAVPGVPVIVLTGLEGPELDLSVLRNGAQDYLAKGRLDPALLQRAALYAVERWRLEERLRISEKMEAVGTLAGGVAHDFNNLLTCILGYENLVRAALPADSPLQADLDEIRKAAESAAEQKPSN